MSGSQFSIHLHLRLSYALRRIRVQIRAEPFMLALRSFRVYFSAFSESLQMRQKKIERLCKIVRNYKHRCYLSKSPKNK